MTDAGNTDPPSPPRDSVRDVRGSIRPTNVSRPGASRDGFRGNEAPVDARQRVFGEYVIEREIGRGGMGVVWLATQRSLGRKVALKVLPNFAAMDTSAVLRFRREAEATGRIAHPGIVPVYGTGEVDGIHYFAMEFIDGPPLGTIIETLSIRQVDRLRESWVEEAQLVERYPSLREPPATGAGNRYVRSCARLCADVANALAAAHHVRVIHRDLKPNNILIHPAGRPVLVDFGLARDEQANTLTRSGEQIGTPAYMAPEQARGHRQIDSRVDIYGLGAVLYELLTLRPPFEGNTSAEISHKILTQEPVPVRKRNPNVPLDLAAIVHRCLAKDADARYPVIEAAELDLRNFLAGRPVTASLPSAMARLHGALQRHRQSLVIGSTAAVAATMIAIGAGIVDDRADVNRGRQALVDARTTLLTARDPDRARDLYERAAALTKEPEAVREQRRRDFRAAFETYYQDKPAGPEVLRRFASVFDDDDRRAVADLLERLAGRGRLRFHSRAIEQATRKLEARAVRADGLEAAWTEVRANEPMPTGEYLLRATSVDGAVAVVWAAIGADDDTSIDPRYLGADEVPPDYVAVVDPRVGQTLAVAQYEFTRGQWRQWLESIVDPALRAEMTPLQWDGGEQNEHLPVRGLSFLQARACAAANGSHLPSAREQWLAGSAGLRGLKTPWGGAMDRSRIVADPFQRSEAMAVDSVPEGQSPLGIFHVLGNVAEVLSAGIDGRLGMGGGSFLDDPGTLLLDGASGTVPVAPLSAIDARHAGAGLRLYRFVAPADDAKTEALAKQRREELRAAGAANFHDWALQRDGTIDYRIELNGIYDGNESSLRPLVTPGYLQMPGTVKALDGHEHDQGASAIVVSSGEKSVLDSKLPKTLRPGQGYRCFLAARLQPVDGMLPQRDAYQLRLPMKRGYGVNQVYTLSLPGDCVVEEVMPPATTWTMGGRTMLSWEPTQTEQIESAVVRLRVDGAFGTALASRGAAERRSREFLTAWNERSSRLADLLDRDFLRQPGTLDRGGALARRDGDTLRFVQLTDSVRIGDIETAELVLDWEMRDRAGQPFVLTGWPFLLQWRHDQGTVRAVRFRPFGQADQGRYDGAGGYVNAHRIRVRIDAIPDTKLVRTQDELCELQVKLRQEALGLEAQVLGYFADANETPEAIRFRLTKGASLLRPGRLLEESAADDGLVQEWLFGGDGDSSRERWVFLRRGSRQLLVRLAAVDRDPKQAASLFAGAAAQQWFTAVQGALHID